VLKEYQRFAFWKRQQQQNSNSNKEDSNNDNDNIRRREEQEQMAKLTAIGFRWTSKHTTFESRFQDLSRYKEKHGDTKVPQACKEFNNLGLWCANIKKQYHAKKMRPEHVAMLETLGMDWGKRYTKKSSKK
jgi:Helicase associated domain